MINKTIEVQNIKVNITSINDNDYICISDFKWKRTYKCISLKSLDLAYSVLHLQYEETG